MIQLVIFDLDGTLVDSAADYRLALNKTFQKRTGREIPIEGVKQGLGEGLRSFMRKHVGYEPKSEEEALLLEKEFFEHYDLHCLQETCIYPGVLNFLKNSKRAHGIVTNKMTQSAKEVIQGLGLMEFPWIEIFGYDSFPERKPDPRPLIEMCQLAGVDPRNAVMIGDGTPDLLAANAAGMRSIAVSYGYGDLNRLNACQPHALIHHFDELDQTLFKLEIQLKND